MGSNCKRKRGKKMDPAKKLIVKKMKIDKLRKISLNMKIVTGRIRLVEKKKARGKTTYKRRQKKISINHDLQEAEIKKNVELVLLVGPVTLDQTEFYQMGFYADLRYL